MAGAPWKAETTNYDTHVVITTTRSEFHAPWPPRNGSPSIAPMTLAEAAPQKRNKGFEETHREMIETAVRLISEKGVEALSIAALARATGVNRTTVYYHFENREALIAAVKAWSSEQ